MALMQSYHQSWDIRGADLRGADLTDTCLVGMLVDGATKLDPRWRLVWELTNRGAKGRNLSGANLSGACLAFVDLQGADLHNADLHGAVLYAADLRGADLTGADLSNAFMKGADLVAAESILPQSPPLPVSDEVLDTKLAGACYDVRTRWPSGFDPRRYGAVPCR